MLIIYNCPQGIQKVNDEALSGRQVVVSIILCYELACNEVVATFLSVQKKHAVTKCGLIIIHHLICMSKIS